MPRLVIRKGVAPGRDHALGGECVVGRHPSATFVLDDHLVSRRHFRVLAQGGVWLLEDLGSTNGTLVNGVAIVNRIRLEPGDEIRVGATVLLFGDPAEGIKKPSVLITDDFDLETEVEARITTPSDSYIAADISDDPQSEANAGEAAIDHLRVIYTLTSITARIMNNRELLEAVMLFGCQTNLKRGTCHVRSTTRDQSLQQHPTHDFPLDRFSDELRISES